MEKFKDVQHYSTTIKSFKRDFSVTYSTNFYMTDEVVRLISSNRLYFSRYEDILLIYRDEGAYWQVSFIAPPLRETKEIKTDKKCVLTLYPNTKKTLEKDAEILKIAEAIGFKRKTCYRYFEIDLEKRKEEIKTELEKSTALLNKKGFFLAKYSSTYGNMIRSLWTSCFGAENVSIDDMTDEIKKTVVAIDKNGKLCGTYLPKENGKSFSLWHLAVDEGCRGNGIARCLTLKLFGMALNSGYTKAFNWIADDNVSSLALHKNLGMVSTDIVAVKYMLETG